MFIWKLTPKNLDDSAWQASSHHGYVIVRAPDEDSAREIAQQAFGIQMRFTPATRVPVGPWKRPALATAELVENGPYDPDGPRALLEPSFETDLAGQPPPR